MRNNNNHNNNYNNDDDDDFNKMKEYYIKLNEKEKKMFISWDDAN